MNRKHQFIPGSLLALPAAMLLIPAFQAKAQSFADDFNRGALTPEYRISTDHIDEERTTISTDGDAVLVSIVHQNPSEAIANDEKARVEFQLQGGDFIESTGMFVGARPEVGTLRFETFGRFFNKTIDGGPVPGERVDDVEMEVILSLGANPEDDYSEFCVIERDAEFNSQPVFNDQKCYRFGPAELALNTPYRIELGINRDTQELVVGVNDQRVTELSPYPFYEVASESKWTRFRVRDGAESGQFRLQSVVVDGSEIDLSSVEDGARYKNDDYDNFDDDPDRTKEIVDGRLKLGTTVSDSEDDNNAFLRFANQSRYIEAELEYSSESSVMFPAGEGFASIRVAGILYNVYSAGESRDLGYNGNVWGSVNLIRNGNDGGRLVGEYCLIRNDSDDWSVSTDLLDGTEDMRCPVFELNLEEDIAYKAALGFDPEQKTVSFSLGGETKTVILDSDVFVRTDETLRVQTRMARGATGTVIGYIDNLRNDPDALTVSEIAQAITDGSNTNVSTDDSNCIDSDGDGYGWDGSATCLPSVADPAGEVDTDTSVESVYDGVACIDTDGDGWGWQEPVNAPGRSCIVTEMVDATDVYSGVPCIDSDNDGWGWQEPANAPGRSCRITTVSDTDGYIGVPCIDSDNDGWGWQQPEGLPGRSCRI